MDNDNEPEIPPPNLAEARAAFHRRAINRNFRADSLRVALECLEIAEVSTSFQSISVFHDFDFYLLHVFRISCWI